MSRNILCSLLITAAVVFCGCSDSGSDNSYTEVCSVNNEAAVISDLSQEETEYLTELFENAKWRKGMLKYHYDYVFVLPNATLEYTPDGAFYDRENDRSFSVPYEQRNELNEMFGLYTY